MSQPFYIENPRGPLLPIIISCPHSGTEIPQDIAATMNQKAAEEVADTDWFVHELYSFAPAMGITLIHAKYSRYVIDLNRDPSGQKLYADGRAETSLVPVKNFALEPIYHQTQPDEHEIKRRHKVYYEPYHLALREHLSRLRQKFSHVLLYDAHSIKRQVSSIRSAPFADLILGDQRGTTAAKQLSQTALAALQEDGAIEVAHNDPFMGGYITRHFGQPKTGIHTLQLEMSQDVYMNEATAQRDLTKERRMASILQNMLSRLAAELEKLS